MAVRIDRTRYMLTPRGSVLQTLSLGRVLLKYLPDQPSADVVTRAEELELVVESSTQSFSDRYREFGPTVAAEEMEEDAFADALLFCHRDRLAQWENFDRAVVHRLASKPSPKGIDYLHLIDRARLAKRILKLLFGQGMDMTRLPFPEQAEHMLRITRVIEQEDLTDPLTELVGQYFTEALLEANERYQAMVERRAARQRGASIDMREINTNLQQAIQDYMIALLAMIRDNDPENVATIRAALRPVDALREQLANGRRTESGDSLGDLGGQSEVEELEGGEASSLVEELVAEQQAVGAQLGLGGEEGGVSGGTSADAALADS